VGNVNGDNYEDIIAGASPGFVPQVAVFSGNGLFTSANPKLLSVFPAGPASYHGGVLVQTAPAGGGNPGTVELDRVFTQLLPLDYEGYLLGMAYKNVTPYYLQLKGGKL
jgi:hypothetical protein